MDNSPGVRPEEIGDMLHRAIAKLVMRPAGDQGMTISGSLQLCAVLEARIEGATHTVAQRQQQRTTPVSEERAE